MLSLVLLRAFRTVLVLVGSLKYCDHVHFLCSLDAELEFTERPLFC